MALLAARSIGAQVTETPVAFDSAGSVRSLTPALVARFSLTPPAWPVQGDFVAARLFASSAGGHVLSVERRTGVIERYSLNGEETESLRRMVAAALTRAGAVVGEDQPETISQPARGTFIRNQMILALLLYGPLLAAQANDGRTATALYLLGAGASYFAISGLSRNMSVTRAQNHLATDGALRGFGVANGILTALAGDVPDAKTAAAVGLAGSIAGSVAGFQYGRGLTDGEAKSATTMSSFAALIALGALGTSGVLDSGNSERAVAGVLVAAGTAGYLLGPRYPRSAKYTVTAGDVGMLWIGALLGSAATLTPFVGEGVDDQARYAAATVGGLAGIVIADRAWVRPYNHSTADVTMMWLGTFAGALLGTGLLVLADASDPQVVLGLVTTGAVLGAIAAHNFVRPTVAGQRGASKITRPSGWLRNAEVEFAPASLALTAAGVHGNHPLLSIRF